MAEFCERDANDIREIQERLLALLPHWNYRISKPFKQLLDEGVSLEMYYCIQTLRFFGGVLTMSEMAQCTQMPKQQMTKMVNRLVDYGFAERAYEPSDRRIIKIKITDKALAYIDHFLTEDAESFQKLFRQMNEDDRRRFKEAIDTILNIFSALPIDREQMQPDAE